MKNQAKYFHHFLEFRRSDNYDTGRLHQHRACIFLNKEMTAAWFDTSVFVRYDFSFPGSKVQKSEYVWLIINIGGKNRNLKRLSCHAKH